MKPETEEEKQDKIWLMSAMINILEVNGMPKDRVFDLLDQFDDPKEKAESKEFIIEALKELDRIQASRTPEQEAKFRKAAKIPKPFQG